MLDGARDWLRMRAENFGLRLALLRLEEVPDTLLMFDLPSSDTDLGVCSSFLPIDL